MVWYPCARTLYHEHVKSLLPCPRESPKFFFQKSTDAPSASWSRVSFFHIHHCSPQCRRWLKGLFFAIDKIHFGVKLGNHWGFLCHRAQNWWKDNRILPKLRQYRHSRSCSAKYLWAHWLDKSRRLWWLLPFGCPCPSSLRTAVSIVWLHVSSLIDHFLIQRL